MHNIKLITLLWLLARWDSVHRLDRPNRSTKSPWPTVCRPARGNDRRGWASCLRKKLCTFLKHFPANDDGNISSLFFLKEKHRVCSGCAQAAWPHTCGGSPSWFTPRLPCGGSGDRWASAPPTRRCMQSERRVRSRAPCGRPTCRLTKCICSKTCIGVSARDDNNVNTEKKGRIAKKGVTYMSKALGAGLPLLPALGMDLARIKSRVHSTEPASSSAKQ